MGTIALDDSWAKLSRAKVHTAELDRDVRGFPEVESRPTFVLYADFEEHPQGPAVVKCREVAPFPQQWGLLYGDVLVNARAALDYLACELVRRGTEPAKAQNAHFPICDDEVDYTRDKLPRYLPGCLSRDLRVVTGYQPWNTAHHEIEASKHPLAWLREHSNTDKHRAIHITGKKLNKIELHVEGVVDFTVDQMVAEPGIERVGDGTKLASVYGIVTGPNPEVKVRSKIEVEPVIDDPTVGLLPLVLAVHSIITTVRQVLLDASVL